jgi:hypothetical protein
MKEIQLTKGKSVMVDDEDYEWLNQWKWHYHNGYATRKPVSGRVFMHRSIMHTPKGMQTDHINGNKLDNQKSNLRVCTSQQNKLNKPKRLDNTSGYKGVTWRKDKNMWQSQIMFNGKRQYIGYFDDLEVSARAYDKKALELFGEFAWLNFPKEAR